MLPRRRMQSDDFFKKKITASINHLRIILKIYALCLSNLYIKCIFSASGSENKKKKQHKDQMKSIQIK